MPSVGDITAHLRLDTTDWDRQIKRLGYSYKRHFYGSLLGVYSYVMTAVAASLAVLLFTR